MRADCLVASKSMTRGNEKREAEQHSLESLGTTCPVVLGLALARILGRA